MYVSAQSLRPLLILLLAAGVAASISAQPADLSEELIDEIDGLYYREEHSAALDLITAARTVQNPIETPLQAALAWRLTRSLLNRVDLDLSAGISESNAGRELSRAVEAAAGATEFYRRQGSSLAADHARALFWLAAAKGRGVQLQGRLKALFAADELRDLLEESILLDPSFSNPYYVLAQLYDQLPVPPVSFGNVDRAVNLGRRAVALHEASRDRGMVPVPFHDYYLELARHLWNRNWSRNRRDAARRRQRAAYGSARGALEQSYHTEAVSAIPPLSDREEAAQLLRRTLHLLQASDLPALRKAKDLAKAEELLREWGIDQPPVR